MNVSEICTRKIVTVRPGLSVSEAAEVMRGSHVGYLVVVEPMGGSAAEKPVGVLTDRDIVVSVVSKNTNPLDLRVGDVMSRELVTVDEERAVKAAVVLMRKHGVRRLPVTGEDGRLVGVLSLDDVLGAIAADLQELVDAIRTERTIEAVLRP
jgi:CBS domain-containing protein